MSPNNDPTIADKIQRKLNVLLWINGALALALIVAVIYFAILASQAHDALCNLRAEQVHRLAQSKDFVASHPNGAFGFTRAQINQQIANSQKTLKALDSLGCTPVETAPSAK